MFSLRCTKRLFDYLGVRPALQCPETTTALGDWYANLAPLEFAGNLIVFVNAKSLLTVALPVNQEVEIDTLAGLFLSRVVNLFAMIGVPEPDITRELAAMEECLFSKTQSKKILGSMNDICFHYDAYAEARGGGERLSLSDVELQLAGMPHRNLELVFPNRTALWLLGSRVPPKSEALS